MQTVLRESDVRAERAGTRPRMIVPALAVGTTSSPARFDRCRDSPFPGCLGAGASRAGGSAGPVAACLCSPLAPTILLINGPDRSGVEIGDADDGIGPGRRDPNRHRSPGRRVNPGLFRTTASILRVFPDDHRGPACQARLTLG
jgi:hypothetical protein